MEKWLSAHSVWLYLATPIVTVLMLAVLEKFLPLRIPTASKVSRWLFHGFLATFTDAISMFVFRIGALGVAFSVQGSHFGILNHARLPLLLSVPLTFLLVDLFQYGSHWARHGIPLLWRFHKIHHSDRDVDFSTGFRFHPGEVILTQTPYLLMVVVLAPPPIAIMLSELVNTVQALLSHANLTFPPSVEKRLNLMFITPRVHRTHHSIRAAEQQANLGLLFSFWDRLFHTYCDQPQAGDRLELGLEEVSAEQSTRALDMLKLPFASPSPEAIEYEPQAVSQE